MDLYEVIRKLHEEKKRLERTIAELEKVVAAGASTRAKSTRGRRSMGHAERMLVSERMRKYWAARRKGVPKSV